MRISLTVTIIAIAMLASPLAYGQARTSGKPSGPAVGYGDRSSLSKAAALSLVRRAGNVAGALFQIRPLPPSPATARKSLTVCLAPAGSGRDKASKTIGRGW